MTGLAVPLVIAIGCSSLRPSSAYTPTLPTSWAPSVTHPFYTLTPGSTWRYSGKSGNEIETTVVEVLADTKTINGVTATVVRDRVYINDRLAEDTFDWFAQDAVGNVWYLGEDSKEIENGRAVSAEGSWQWGVDGALPGIVMWADPAAHVGEDYRQEYYKGEAEDWGKVLGVTDSVTVPGGAFSACVRTEDWSGIESGRENKYYCRGVGLVLEVGTRGGERNELISRIQP